jgi:tetratricopeptide (TPR) repeat protein
MTPLISAPSAIDKKTFRKCILVFFILSFLIYGKSISNRYSMDDEYVTFNNEQVHGGISSIPEIFRTTYSIDSRSSFEYRPIVKVTYAIEYEFFGENPHVSHFINILFYVLCLLLLFYVIMRLIPQQHYIFAFIVTLLFLVHPLQSEVVMSLKNRDVMLSFLGALLSLLFYLRFVEGKGYLNLVTGLFFLLFAIMSKKDSVTFFFIIPFTLWFFKSINWKQVLWILVSYLPVALVFKTAAKSVKNEVLRKLLLWENPLFLDSTLLERIPQGFYSIYFYLKMFLIPHPLISYYGYNQVPIVGWDNVIVWLVIMAFVVAGYFVFRSKAYKTVWFYGIIFFLVTISMFTNVVVPVVGIVAERFAFIPSIGLCMAAAYGMIKYFKIPVENLSYKLRSVSNNFWIVTGLIVIVFGARTFARNDAWKDAYTLYKTDAEVALESAHTHSLLAAAAITRMKNEPRMSKAVKREMVLLAEKHYLESIRIIPDYTASHNNVGMLYYTYMQNNDKAIYHLKKAIELDTNYVEAHFNLATTYSAIKQYDMAERYYLKAIQLNPNFVNSYLSLSNMYAANKQFDKIIAVNQEAINKGIKTDIIYINIGNVYFMNGDTLKALPFLEEAIRHNPRNNGVNTFLSNYYKAKGNKEKADHYSGFLKNSR